MWLYQLEIMCRPAWSQVTSAVSAVAGHRPPAQSVPYRCLCHSDVIQASHLFHIHSKDPGHCGTGQVQVQAASAASVPDTAATPFPSPQTGLEGPLAMDRRPRFRRPVLTCIEYRLALNFVTSQILKTSKQTPPKISAGKIDLKVKVFVSLTGELESKFPERM